jgi:hypothetical protein
MLFRVLYGVEDFRPAFPVCEGYGYPFGAEFPRLVKHEQAVYVVGHALTGFL